MNKFDFINDSSIADGQPPLWGRATLGYERKNFFVFSCRVWFWGGAPVPVDVIRWRGCSVAVLWPLNHRPV